MTSVACSLHAVARKKKHRSFFFFLSLSFFFFLSIFLSFFLSLSFYLSFFLSFFLSLFFFLLSFLLFLSFFSYINLVLPNLTKSPWTQVYQGAVSRELDRTRRLQPYKFETINEKRQACIECPKKSVLWHFSSIKMTHNNDFFVIEIIDKVLFLGKF